MSARKTQTDTRKRGGTRPVDMVQPRTQIEDCMCGVEHVYSSLCVGGEVAGGGKERIVPVVANRAHSTHNSSRNGNNFWKWEKGTQIKTHQLKQPCYTTT